MTDQTVNNHIDTDIFSKFSSFKKFLRTITRCLRFASNCKTAKGDRNVSFLTPEELAKAEQAILRNIQNQHYSDEIQRLKQINL
jgi:hypothetical protein